MTQCICICQLVICDYSRCTLLNYIFGCLLISTGSSYRLADSSMLVGFLSVPRNFLRVLCMSSRSLKPIPESNKVLIWIACYHIIVGCILALNISIRVYNFDNLTKFTILWFVHLNQFSHEYTLVLLHCSLFIGQFFFEKYAVLGTFVMWHTQGTRCSVLWPPLHSHCPWWTAGTDTRY